MQALHNGKYVLLERLATGGMADVYLGREEMTPEVTRPVVVKAIRPTLAHDQRMTARFLDEARYTMQCAHPNLPHAYQLVYEGGAPYLVLEYLEGVTVLELIRAAARTRRPLPLATVLRIACGVADALDHLHGLRDADGTPLAVVHRDVSPANIMVTYDGGVRLIDLGIARSTRHRADSASGFEGKYSYQAPEQVLAPDQVDARTDLFALGIVMYEMLTSTALFRGDDAAETLHRVLLAPIPDPAVARPDLPDELGAVIRSALDRDPDRRPASAAAMLSALEGAAARLGLVASPRALAAEVRALCGEPTPLAARAGARLADPALADVVAALDALAVELRAAREVDEDEVDDYVIEETAAGDPEFDAVLAWVRAA